MCVVCVVFCFFRTWRNAAHFMQLHAVGKQKLLTFLSWVGLVWTQRTTSGLHLFIVPAVLRVMYVSKERVYLFSDMHTSSLLVWVYAFVFIYSCVLFVDICSHFNELTLKQWQPCFEESVKMLLFFIHIVDMFRESSVLLTQLWHLETFLDGLTTFANVQWFCLQS